MKCIGYCMYSRVKNVVMGVLALVVVGGGFFGVFSLMQSESPYAPLVVDVVEVRIVVNDSLGRARIIDDMDGRMGDVVDGEIVDQWSEIASCLSETCSDDVLFDFILSIVISHPDKVPNAKLVADVIVAHRLWGADDVIKFSRAVTAAHDGVGKLDVREVSKKWSGIVACDGKCEYKNDLVFDSIRAIVLAEKKV